MQQSCLPLHGIKTSVEEGTASANANTITSSTDHSKSESSSSGLSSL
ncbi:hypothetical protein A2U01_0072319, partial [Trifolium medium]|nr:hypothetical protein [Trifolium medium]